MNDTQRPEREHGAVAVVDERKLKSTFLGSLVPVLLAGQANHLAGLFLSQAQIERAALLHQHRTHG